MEKIITNSNLALSFGRLCLDFANTLEWRARENPTDRLDTYSAIVEWCQKKGLLETKEVRHYLALAERFPERGSKTLIRTIAMRETFYRIVVSIVREREPSASDLAVLNTELSQIMPNARIGHKNGGFDWGWSANGEALDQILWPVLKSITDLLTSEELGRVGVCDGEGCAWLFFDNSRNRSRRWCDMGDCGNRAKARRYYARKRDDAKTVTA